MIISDFEAVTLVDFPGVIASVIFTSGCNLRCRFCHNPDLALGAGGDKTEDFLKYLETARIDGVSITGGEPLIHDELPSFLSLLKSKGLKVKLDTNGFLSEKLWSVLLKNLVDYVAMDIKGLNADEVEFVTRRKVPFEAHYETFKVIKKSKVPYELRLTVWKTFNEADIAVFAEKFSGAKVFLQKARYEGRILDRRFAADISHADFDAVHKLFEKYIEVSVRV